MLSKNERNIFKLARKSKENKIKYTDAQESLKLGRDDVQSACNGLILKGLAEEKKYSPTHGSWIPWGIVLSEKGRHRFRCWIESLCIFLAKSILVPMVVSILTTLLTMWITGRLK